MSKHVVSLVYSRKAGSLLRKAVLAYMADVANHDGTGVWSSKQRIADEIEASKKGVRECIKSLVADGILSEVGQRKCMNGYTIEYAINLDVVSALEPMPHQKGEGGINAPVTHGDLTGELDSPDGGTGFPQTVLNRPKPTSNDVVRAQDAPKPPKAKKGSQLPDGWKPSETDFAFAQKKGLTPQEINHESEKFIAHHTAKGTVSKSWPASWRTWCLNASKWKSERASANSGSGSARTTGNAAFDLFNELYEVPQGTDDTSGFQEPDSFIYDAEPMGGSWR